MSDETTEQPSADDITKHPAVLFIVTLVTVGILVGFAAVTFLVLRSDVSGVDAATKGALVQTWNNLAVGAAAVWTASRIIDQIRGGAKK